MLANRRTPFLQDDCWRSPSVYVSFGAREYRVHGLDGAVLRPHPVVACTNMITQIRRLHPWMTISVGAEAKPHASLISCDMGHQSPGDVTIVTDLPARAISAAV